jgi:hypothetical protein
VCKGNQQEYKEAIKKNTSDENLSNMKKCRKD